MHPVISLCRDLIQIPSVNPEGNPGTHLTGEAKCASWLANWIQSHFPSATVSTPEVLPNRPNIVARFPSDRPNKPRILFAPHTDTVSIVGMTIDPFGGTVSDGKLWGRGASDTKGSMASMLWAIHQCRDILPHLTHEIWFAGLAGEEAGQHGAHALAKQQTFDLVIAGEPTGMNFVHTHKGSMFLQLKTTGKAVHGAHPELGINAIYPMAQVLLHVRDSIAPWLTSFSDPILGHSTINAGTIDGGSKTNIVPDFCTATLDLRLVPSQSGAFKEELFQRLHGVCPGLEINVQHAPPLFTSPQHPLLQRLQSLGSQPIGAPWFCDAAIFAQNGSPAIAMGPGSIAQAHTRDEWIATQDLEDSATFFEKFLRSLV